MWSDYFNFINAIFVGLTQQRHHTIFNLNRKTNILVITCE